MIEWDWVRCPMHDSVSFRDSPCKGCAIESKRAEQAQYAKLFEQPVIDQWRCEQKMKEGE